MIPSPADLARAALRRIAELRIAPTPAHFARYYHEAAGEPQPAAAPAVDPSTVRRVHELVESAAATTEQVVLDLDRGGAGIGASLDGLVQDGAPNETALVLRAVMATARDMQATIRASHAELVSTRDSLAEIKAELAESRKLISQDALTGTENRRAMDAILAREIERARCDDEPLSLAMVDLDHFKRVNDTFGHATGDAALVHLTQLAKSMLRGHDAFIRYGGEEFLLVLPGTGLQGAVFVCGRLLGLLEKTPLQYEGKTIPLSFSAGVATLQPEDSEQSVLKRADVALYEAKRAGRRRVVAGN